MLQLTNSNTVNSKLCRMISVGSQLSKKSVKKGRSSLRKNQVTAKDLSLIETLLTFRIV